MTREVRGASLQVAVTLRNEGSIAFTLRNLQVVALMQNPQDPSQLTPIATLLPDAEPADGVNLGPLVPARGPFIFSNDQVFPQLVDRLRRRGRAQLRVQLAGHHGPHRRPDDRDGLPASVEAMNNCSDQDADIDDDGLDDRFETLIGWTVDLGSRGQRRIFSSCASADSDGDGIGDREEATATATVWSTCRRPTVGW